MISAALERGFSKRSTLVIGILILAAIAIGWVWLWRRSAAQEYTTRPVERGEVRSVVNATGTVEAFLTVQVGTQVSGQMEALHADYNSVVRRGQLLAKLDPRNYQAVVDGAKANLLSAQAREHAAEADLNSQIASRQSAQANVESARVARDNAARILERYEELNQQGILSQNDYDTAKSNADAAAAKYEQAVAQVQQGEAQIKSGQAQVEQAKAQVEQAQASLKQAQVNLEYTSIYSPVDGVVVSRNVDVGQTVAASLAAPTLFVIANDLEQMQVHASVDEADIGSISQAADVSFTVDAYASRTFRGTISEIRLEPQTVQNVVTYSVIIDVNNERLELKPGMTANIGITVAHEQDVLKIPNTALRYLPPGVTREQVSQMIREARGDAGAPTGVGTMPFARAGEAGSAADRSQRGAWWGPSGSKSAAAPERAAGGRVTEAEESLAPGQMWDPSAKIQFPHQELVAERPAIVWVLGKDNQPEARHVVVGITDGTWTQLVSGDLKEGDAVIVGDNIQVASTTTPTSGGGFGGGPRIPLGGPR